MRLYVGITALWACCYNQAGSESVNRILDSWNPPFELSPLHEAQMGYLLNARGIHKDPQIREAANKAKEAWVDKLRGGLFVPAREPFNGWHEAFALVRKWQAGKLKLETPHSVVHAALAGLNDFDTFLSLLPESRRRAESMGLVALPTVLT